MTEHQTKAAIYLDWPSNSLSPNARLHWSTKAKAVKAYRNACGWKVRAGGIGKIDAETVHVKMTFYPPTNAHYDLDGLISRMKSGLDGIADVIGVDDSKWELSASKATPIGKEGMVKVELEWSTREARVA